MSSPLPPIDSCFRSIDHTGALQHIAALAILKGIPKDEVLTEKVNSLLAEFPRLSSVFFGHSPTKEKKLDTFKPASQCHFHSISGDLSFLLDHASEILMTPFKEHLPLWEIHLISSPSSDTQSILLFKLHHSLGDGISGLYFFHRLLGGEKQKERSPKTQNREHLLSTLSFLFKEVIKKRPPLPIHGLLSKKRKLFTYALPNSSIQKIKQKSSCTSYAVVLSIISSALSTYLKEKNVTATHFRAFVPVTIRGKNNISDLGNQIGGASIDIPLGIKEAETRIKKINFLLQSLMYKKAYSAYYLCAKVFSKFPLRLQTALCKFASTRLSGICTFLQAPSQKLSIDNCEVLHEFAIPALLPEQGLSFGFIKQGEYMNVSLILDPSLINDMDILDACMIDALNEISDNKGFGTSLAHR